VTVRVLLRHYGFAMAYLAGVVAAGLAYTRLDPHAQARLIAWASTNVANLEHEPVGPLLVSAFVTSGFFAAWVQGLPLAFVSDLGPERALLLLGIVLVQLSTGNVVVRLVLTVTRTVNPARHGGASDPEIQLKGGRLLGPMERVVIVGLGVAGQLTAASIVIAAKGLLRFPELSSDREQERIHRLTEYFLVGSFVSWLLALSSLVLLVP